MTSAISRKSGLYAWVVLEPWGEKEKVSVVDWKIQYFPRAPAIFSHRKKCASVYIDHHRAKLLRCYVFCVDIQEEAVVGADDSFCSGVEFKATWPFVGCVINFISERLWRCRILEIQFFLKYFLFHSSKTQRRKNLIIIKLKLVEPWTFDRRPAPLHISIRKRQDKNRPDTRPSRRP